MGIARVPSALVQVMNRVSFVVHDADCIRHPRSTLATRLLHQPAPDDTTVRLRNFSVGSRFLPWGAHGPVIPTPLRTYHGKRTPKLPFPRPPPGRCLIIVDVVANFANESDERQRSWNAVNFLPLNFARRDPGPTGERPRALNVPKRERLRYEPKLIYFYLPL